MQTDTRKLLTTGSVIFGTGAVCVISLFAVFGGTNHFGPHSNGGWLMLIFALGCVPMGCLLLILGVAKLIGERTRS